MRGRRSRRYIRDVTHLYDSTRSRITLRTGTSGLFSAMAHDLEIEATGVRGEAEFEGSEPRGWLECPVTGLHVLGPVKHGRVDTQGLSPAERAEIERRIRELVLPMDLVRVDATPGKLRVRGPKSTEELSVRMERKDEGDVATFAGTVTLSMKRMGVGEVKGPLGAFKVTDAVEVTFRAVFVKRVLPSS